MTGTRLQALAVVVGSTLFLVFVALCVRWLDTRLIYMCMLAAALLGATFLLGLILSMPGVKQAFEATVKWIKRNSRKICIGVVGLLALAVGWLLIMENDNQFVTRHRTELFWLVFFPGMFMAPYFYAVIAARLRKTGSL
jgi:hypothetical protein